MTSSHLLSSWTPGFHHVGLIVGISRDCSLFLLVDRFIGTVPNIVFLCIISNVPDINLLYDLSSVVPGEVVTPPCIRGFGIQRFGYYCRVYNINASAGAVIVLGQTAGKSLFSLLQCLRLLILGTTLSCSYINSLALLCPGA